MVKWWIVLLLVPHIIAKTGDSQHCTPCIKTTKTGRQITKTLVFSTQLACKKKSTHTCTHNGTTYSICEDNNSKQCFDPTSPTHRYNINITAGNAILANKDFHNIQLSQTVVFDACKAMDEGSNGCGSLAWRQTYSHNEKYICARTNNQHDSCGKGTFCGDWKCVDFQSRGTTVRSDTIPKSDAHKRLYITRLNPPSPCYQHTCNPINLTFPVPANWLGQQTWKGVGNEYGLGIDGTGSDPSVKIKIVVSKINLTPLSHSLLHSYYQEFRALPSELGP